MKTYAAPWGTSLVIVSVLGTVVCVSVGGILVARGPIWSGLLPLAVVAGAALFAVRGYSVTADALLIRRLLWSTRVPLAGLRDAQATPDAMSYSFRAFGNGGLFSFSGFFYNRALGFFRAFVTDRHRTVVLRFANRRAMVVSPDAPEEFVTEVGSFNRG